MLLGLRAYGADSGAEASVAHSQLGDAVEQVCKQDPVNACDALIELAVNAGLAQEERTRLARQRLDAAAARLERVETPRTVDPDSPIGQALLQTVFLGSSFRVIGTFRLLGLDAASRVRFRPPAVDAAMARRWVAQAVRLDPLLSKASVTLGPDAAERLAALQVRESRELERERREEANEQDYLPEKAISASVELGSLAGDVNEKAIAFLEPMRSDRSRPDLERIRMALHLGILKLKKGDEAGAKAALQEALTIRCRVKVVLPHDMPEDTPVGFAGFLEKTRTETSCADLPAVAVGAAGAGAAVAGVVFTASWVKSHEDEHLAFVQGNSEAYKRSQSDAVWNAARADVLCAAGFVGAAYLLFFNHPPRAADAPYLLLVPGPSGLAVGGSF